MLVQSLISQGANNTPVNLYLAFRCTTLEIIMAYCLNQSPGAIKTPGFRHHFLISAQRWVSMNWIFKYLPAIRPLLMNPPRYIVNLLPASARGVFDFLHQIDLQLDEILANPEILQREDQRKTVFSHLLELGGSGADRALTRVELLQEAHALLLAGSDTVGHTCYVGFFHVLKTPGVIRRLVDEINHAWPDKDLGVPSSTLEKLPYLVSS
jgi:cytochrome P450